jgi:hypothetical protein
MAYIVFHENRPFCANDFLRFQCEGKEHQPKYGTIRNKFAKFTKKGIIELNVKGNPSFYTLKGHKFGRKSMTLNHAGGNHLALSSNHPLYKMLQNMVLDKQAVHNIRLRLEVPDIYNTISFLHKFDINPVSKDIETPYWNVNYAKVQIRIHKTNTVSVIIGCSQNPIPLDHNGFNRLHKILGIAQGYLKGKIDDKLMIPDFDNWLITMWHFNRDGLKEYTGEMFSITVEKAHHIIERIYSKYFKRKTRIRNEIQEYPNKTVEEAIKEKFNVDAHVGGDVDVDVTQHNNEL